MLFVSVMDGQANIRNTAERLYRYCRKFISVLQNVHMDSAELLRITKPVYEYCKAFMCKLKSICANTAEPFTWTL
jgi:hypothetical protein